MKTGIENSDLRYRSQQFRDNLHALQLGSIVEWRKNRNTFDRLLDLGGHHCGLEMMRAAVDHPVSHQINVGRLEIACVSPLHKLCSKRSMDSRETPPMASPLRKLRASS